MKNSTQLFLLSSVPHSRTFDRHFNMVSPVTLIATHACVTSGVTSTLLQDMNLNREVKAYDEENNQENTIN